MNTFKLPESEVQGTPLSSEELKDIITHDNKITTCQCHYAVSFKNADNSETTFTTNLPAQKAQDCAAGCGSECKGYSEGGSQATCLRYNWLYVEQESGSWKVGDKS